MYKKTIWKNQNVENPRNFRILDNLDGTKQILDSFGEVKELGTPVNADNMNHIEEGIASCAIRYYKETESYEKGEWALGIVDGKKEIYQSLINDNLGNLLSDSSFWRKMTLGAEIGQPIITLNNSIEDNEIWLEGAEVSKADYPNLYAIYGNTYGTPIHENNFVLPDFRNRTIWGASDFGYIEAGLPNITGHIAPLTSSKYPTDGAFEFTGNDSAGNAYTGANAYKETLFDASLSNSIYGNSDTVQPPSIKVRVKTKFE